MEFLLFLINGLILGGLATVIQYLMNKSLEDIFIYHQMIATVLTMSPIIFINFLSQKKIIFKKHGSIILFFFSCIFIMLLVSVGTEIFNQYKLFNYRNTLFDLNLNFVAAGLMSAPISYLLKKYIVFKNK